MLFAVLVLLAASAASCQTKRIQPLKGDISGSNEEDLKTLTKSKPQETLSTGELLNGLKVLDKDGKELGIVDIPEDADGEENLSKKNVSARSISYTSGNHGVEQIHQVQATPNIVHHAAPHHVHHTIVMDKQLQERAKSHGEPFISLLTQPFDQGYHPAPSKMDSTHQYQVMPNVLKTHCVPLPHCSMQEIPVQHHPALHSNVKNAHLFDIIAAKNGKPHQYDHHQHSLESQQTKPQYADVYIHKQIEPVHHNQADHHHQHGAAPNNNIGHASQGVKEQILPHATMHQHPTYTQYYIPVLYEGKENPVQHKHSSEMNMHPSYHEVAKHPAPAISGHHNAGSHHIKHYIPVHIDKSHAMFAQKKSEKSSHHSQAPVQHFDPNSFVMTNFFIPGICTGSNLDNYHTCSAIRHSTGSKS